MTQKLYQKIREALERNPALTQKGLAAHMGMNASAVNRMLHGTRNIMADEIPLIENYIGEKLTLSETAPPAPSPSAPVPVYGPGLAAAGPLDWAPRHPAQGGIQGAFAIYAFSDDMAPRYFKGELVYIHPGRPARENDDCLIVLNDGTARLRRLIRSGRDNLRLGLFSPAQEETIALKDIRALHAVVGRG